MATDLTPIEPPDAFYLRAAQGWLELGNWREAEAELQNIAPALRDHTAVLEVRWSISAAAKKWENAAEVARTTAEKLPDLPFCWIHWAYSLHELKQTKEAREVLMRVVDKFPDEYIMRYNLACYACQLGDLAEARTWLAKAIELAGRDSIRAMASHDPDLEPLMKEMGGI